MLQPKLSFIVTAAGKGIRFGNSTAKQFKKINGIPIYIYSLLSIVKLKNVNEVLLTINKSIGIASLKNELKKYRLDKVKVVIGSDTRAESVYTAFNKIEGKPGFVVIHDSVRPNFNFALINKIIQQIKNNSGIIVGSKIQDTIKTISGNSLRGTVNRDKLWVAETPQIFKYSALKKCYLNSIDFTSYTDECQLMERNNFKVKIFENLEYNNKITTKKDFDVYKKLLRYV